jgi:hypothetical protein
MASAMPERRFPPLGPSKNWTPALSSKTATARDIARAAQKMETR